MSERRDEDERRERILDAALDLMAQDGYRGLSMRRVARASGMSAGGVAHHFHDLPALLFAVLDLRDERMTRGIEALGPAANPHVILERVMQGVVADPVSARLFATLSIEAIDPEHPAHAYFRMRAVRTVDAMRPMLEEYVPQPDVLAIQILAVMEGLQSLFVREPETFDILRHWRAIAKVLLADIPLPAETAATHSHTAA